MSAGSEPVSIDIENPLLLRWRELSRKQRKIHGDAYRYFKKRYDAVIYSNIMISLAVGCVNIVFGIRHTGEIGIAVTVSGCLSLLAGAVSSLSSTMGWSERYNKHDEVSTRYSELVREINMESFLSSVDDGAYRNISDFIRHVAADITRLEERAPQIPKSLENCSS